MGHVRRGQLRFHADDLHDSPDLAYWGYAASITTLIVAVLGPVLGTLADTKGFKKPIFVAFIAVGVVGCIGMGFTSSWLVFLIIFILAKVGYSGSLIFYDSMLPDITTEKRMDDVSSQGYAWGYIGSCVPFLASLVLVLMYDKIGITMNVAMTIAFVIIAVWWVGMTIPLLRIYQQKHYVERQPNAFKESFLRIGRTLRDVKKHKKIFLFLLAFFFYIDGVYTIIDMATAYGSALGLDTTGLLLALLVTQIVAFPFAILFGRLASKYATEKLIIVCIFAYLRHLSGASVAVLGAGGVRRHVPGRYSGAVPVLLYEDYSAGADRRVLWPSGYLR